MARAQFNPTLSKKILGTHKMHRDAPHKDSLSRLEQVTVSCNLIEKEKVKQNEMLNKRTREKRKKKAKKTQIIYHIRIQSISNKNIN